MLKIALIFLAGGGGSLLRYALAGLVQRWTDSSFPLGTLVVNVTGCVAIGFLAALLTGPVLIREEYRLAVLIGLLGGFTTFSTFGYETLTLANAGQFGLASLNIVLSNGLGLAAAWLGARTVVMMYGSP